MNVADPHDMSRPSWKLYNRLLLLGASADEASELMNGYAHELAERQRYEHNEVGGGCSLGVCDGDRLADLIDPEVDYDGDGAGPVRPDEEPTT
jgi:hypothetical protein